MSVTSTRYGNLEAITISWTADGSGNYTESFGLNGQVVKVVTNPDGSSAPSADYDVTVIDGDGVDVLNGDLGDRHTSTSESVVPDPLAYHIGDVTFTVANAGDGGAGVAVFYVLLPRN